MKELVKKIFHDDLTKYGYLLVDAKKYNKQKLICLFVVMVLVFPFTLIQFGINYISIVAIIFVCCMGYKIPYFLLKLMHNQKRNEIIGAIPLWINSIYSLIGENNIKNSIKLSYENVPASLEKDLSNFIKDIELNDGDRSIYMEFLSKYEIDGFREIMMKLYEFRNLSKDNLRYEILTLNKSLGKIRQLKMQNRCKNELAFVDILGNCMIMVPSLYVFFISTLLSSIIL